MVRLYRCALGSLLKVAEAALDSAKTYGESARSSDH